jgi:choline dehydrogenase-like flavoprotein
MATEHYDFGVITRHGGISPAWPCTYDAFEPWYAAAEDLYVVHGAGGEDPTDGPRSGDYPSGNAVEGMNIAATAHEAGTVRFGTDATTSVLDVNCKAHDLDNLYVVDSSFFPSIGAVNPTLTIIANALRVGQHLTERLP